MKHVVRNTLMAVVGIGLAGCEWGGSGDSDSWNSRFDFANFSGNYRGNGGYLVSVYTVSTSTGGGASGELNVKDEEKDPCPGGLQFGGRTKMTPIKPGSFRLFLDGGKKGQFVDGGGGKLTGQYLSGTLFDGEGTISYDNGTYGLSTLQPVDFPKDAKVTLNYTVQTSGGTTVTVTSPEAGGTGVQIIAFNVQQEGNRLRLTDNMGKVYEGKFTSIGTSGGTTQDTANPTFSVGDQVIGQFEASGTSAAGLKVKLIGSFQATIASVSTSTAGSSITLTDRRILGTWIEDGGVTGDINGVTESASTTAQ